FPRFGGHDRERAQLDAANDRQPGRDADAVVSEETMQVVDAADRTAVERHNQIAVAQPGLLARTSRLDRHDEYGGRRRQPMRNNKPPRHWHVLTADADVAAPNAAVAYAARRDEASGV